MSTDKELRQLRLEKGLSAREMATVIQRRFPKFDKTVLSKCEHGEEYGVEIRPEALDALYAEFDPGGKPPQKPRKADGHRLTHSVKARLPDGLYAQLQRQMEADGYATNQDLITELVMKYIEEGLHHV